MRTEDKPFLKVYSDFKILQRDIRIPNMHKRLVRHACKTTFVVKNQAFRHVCDPHHARLIKPYGWFYSTSANESGKSYESEFCRSVSDIIVEDFRGLSEESASKIFLLTTTHIKQLR
jgi:tRNA A37 threonylcarbamoyladenosine synthetase subunit TsaC/SUA5/YrdC